MPIASSPSPSSRSRSTTAVTAFRTPGVPGKVRLFAAAALGAILFQSVVGGFAARWGAPAGIAIVHLAAAMLFLAFALVTLAAIAAARGTPHWLAELGRAPDASADRPFAIVATFGAATALILLIFGASTSATGAFACATWPLCAWGAAGTDTPGGHPSRLPGHRVPGHARGGRGCPVRLAARRIRNRAAAGGSRGPAGRAAEWFERPGCRRGRSHLDIGAASAHCHALLDHHARGRPGGLGTATGTHSARAGRPRSPAQASAAPTASDVRYAAPVRVRRHTRPGQSNAALGIGLAALTACFGHDSSWPITSP